jgi:RNA polymerase sigma factor (sigma-70 family)
MADRLHPLRGDPLVTALVIRARDGNKQAWDALVDRYISLVWSTCQKSGLDRDDAAHVSQTVWLRLVDHLDKLRDPAELPGWLVSTAQGECGRVRTARSPQAPGQALNPQVLTDEANHDLLVAQRRAALRGAFTQLSPRCQRLISMLSAEPPVPLPEISAMLGIPVESIRLEGSRCLETVRRESAVAALSTSKPAA